MRPLRRVVVKIGSGVLAPGGELDGVRVDRLAGEIADLARSLQGPGAGVVVVSSGAVASGFRAMGLSAMPRSIAEKQAAAAVGQVRLMASWIEAFALRGVVCAQVLLTVDDLDRRRSFLNARHTLDRLLHHGVAPIVNENDSVAYDEIKFGDNDQLSARVAALIEADLLVMLSTVPGVLDEAGNIIDRIDDASAAAVGSLVRDGIEPQINQAQQGATKHGRANTARVGTGGMGSKLSAAALAAELGVPSVIAPGREPGVLSAIARGESVGTRIPSSSGLGMEARKRWIHAARVPRGSIIVDDGASKALVERGASLLPKGVVGVEGEFAEMSAVEIRTQSGNTLGRGISAYSSADVRRIMGKPSDQIESVLGYTLCDEIVHRDDFVLRAGQAARSTPTESRDSTQTKP